LNEEFSKRGVAMVAVDFGDPPETIAAYFSKAKLGLTPVRQEKDEVSRALGVRSYPTTYVVGADGKVKWRAVGFDEAALRAALEAVAPAK
jgi:hypothetical protein